jgi:glycosyltransferase involved in cell wall biosynthesis
LEALVDTPALALGQSLRSGLVTLPATTYRGLLGAALLIAALRLWLPADNDGLRRVWPAWTFVVVGVPLLTLLVAAPSRLGIFGELSMFLRDIVPQARIVLHCEYFFRAEGGDVGFDPIYGEMTVDTMARTRMLNTGQLVQLEAADWGMAPTIWQRSRYPDWVQAKMSVIHEGVDTIAINPDGPASFTLPDGRSFRRGDPLVTYTARHLEAYRGFHHFMEALVTLQKLRPDAHAVVVGGSKGAYGGPPPGGGTWREWALKQVDGRLDLTRVHFFDWLRHDQLHTLFRVSAAHVYLTFPFVLSWSVLEAMACGAAVLGSATAPVQEVIADGVNGRLVDFFDSDAIAHGLADMLANPAALVPLRAAARASVVEHYDLQSRCLPQWVTLLEGVARSGSGLG